MKKIALIGFLSILFGFYSYGQVKDISVTVAPTAEYTWWDNETILKDTPFVGGRVGFGFGQYFEIRGLYMKSMDLKGSLEDVNWDYANDLAEDLEETEVDVTRYGGELKANIGFDSWLAPYITVGTGVQKFKFKRENQGLDDYEEEQIYASLGLGAKFNLSDRLVFALEGRNTMFNLNEGNPYLEPNFNADGEDNKMYNWSALASLEFYLGGRDPKETTALDRAYRDSFRNGMKGFKFSFEPGGMYINFDDDSPLIDSYFLGGGIGFDISEYIGLRGFYYQTTKDYDFKFEINSDLKIYGGNVIARLNDRTGVTPYISLGGGYINVDDNYYSEEGFEVKDGAAFAMGGLGIEVPLSKYVSAYGSANYMMTTDHDVDVDNISDPSKLKDNVAYRAGLRFQIGGRTEKPEHILSKYEAEHEDEMSELRAEYQERIDKLNEELEKAYAEDDIDKAVSILEERKRNERELAYAEGQGTRSKEMVRMSRSEFEDLVDEVLRKLDEEEMPSGYERERIQQLEDNLLRMNKNAPQSSEAKVSDANQKILDELKKLNDQVSRNSDLITQTMINQKPNQPDAIIINPNTGETGETRKTVTRTEDGKEIEVVESTQTSASSWANEGFSVFTGPAFADDFSWNLGFRSYHNMGNTNKFKFMPEVYLGLAGESSFGISANVLYQFNDVRTGKLINPYIGLGLGFFKLGDTDFGTNFIVGTEIDVLDGKVFVDYSSHNMFDINQFSVGYRFTF